MPKPQPVLTLTESEEAFVLSHFPRASAIFETKSYRPGYMDYPAQVGVRMPGGQSGYFGLKKRESLEPLIFEAKVLRAMTDIGLAVPEVVGLTEKDIAESEPMLLLAELPGKPLAWIDLHSLDDADLSCRLLISAVDAMHALTETIRMHEIASEIPTFTLQDELDQIHKSGEWLSEPIVAAALECLPKVLNQIDTPIQFSNGDYNPINFLQGDGKLTGWLDFELAKFEDPYIGFVKFMMWSFDNYGWGAGPKTGLVERYLYDHGVSRREFAPRLMLRCISTLQKSVSFDEQPRSQYGTHLLGLIERGLDAL